MPGKILFYVSAFVTAWTGLILMFQGYVIPGALITGLGYVLFRVVCPTEEG